MPIDDLAANSLCGRSMRDDPVGADGDRYRLRHSWIHGGLHLTGKILAGIYLGKITNWDNPAISAINKTLTLPDLKITPVWQSAPSGDTYAFTNYLEDIAPATRNKLGLYASTVSWPIGVGASDGAGAIAVVSMTSGSIGYANDALLAAAGDQCRGDTKRGRKVRDADPSNRPRRGRANREDHADRHSHRRSA